MYYFSPQTATLVLHLHICISVYASLQSAVLQRTAAQRDRWRAEITVDGVSDTEFIHSPIYVDFQLVQVG